VALAQFLGRLIPRQGENPSQSGLFQLHGVVQCGGALVEDQRDRAARNLVLIQRA
jgi:hypothetical protein